MTHTRYIFHRMLGALGISFRNRRIADISNETHLLREAEKVLGEAVWRKAEAIEAISNDYWNLRKLDLEHQKLTEEAEQHRSEAEDIQSKRAHLYKMQSAEKGPALTEEREKIIKDLENWAIQRELNSQEARDIKSQFESTKTQAEVMKLEDPSDEKAFERLKKRRIELKQRYEEIKDKNAKLEKQVEQGEIQLKEVEAKISEVSKSNRESAVETSMAINETNSKLSKLRSEFSTIEFNMRKLYGKIGRHISRNAYSDPACREAAAPKKGLVDIMAALRQSIRLNERLSGRRS